MAPGGDSRRRPHERKMTMEKIVHMIDPYLGNINRRGVGRSKCGQDLDPGIEWTEFPGRTTCQACMARVQKNFIPRPKKPLTTRAS